MVAPFNFSVVWSGKSLFTQTFDHGLLDQIYAIESKSHAHPWPKNNFVSSIKNANQHCIALTSDEDIVAYCVVSIVADEGELLLFVVNRDYQNKGVGSLFLDALLHCLQTRVASLFLEVRFSNIAARAVYEKVGFNEVGIRHNYYPAVKYTDRNTSLKVNKNNQPEDAVLYAMDFNL